MANVRNYINKAVHIKMNNVHKDLRATMRYFYFMEVKISFK